MTWWWRSDNTCCLHRLRGALMNDDRLPDPELFREGGFWLASRMFVEGDIRGTGAQVRRLREFAQAEDPLADAVVAMFGRLEAGRGRGLFEAALGGGDRLDRKPAGGVGGVLHQCGGDAVLGGRRSASAWGSGDYADGVAGAVSAG